MTVATSYQSGHFFDLLSVMTTFAPDLWRNMTPELIQSRVDQRELMGGGRRRSSATKIASVPWRWGHSWANSGPAERTPGMPESTCGVSRMSTPGMDVTTSATTSLVSAGTGEQVT